MSNTGISLTGRLDPGMRANCSLFQKNFSDTRFIRFASQAGGLDDLLNGSRTELERNLRTLRVTGYSESAAINRHVVGDARALQERKQLIHPDLESCGGHREMFLEA